MGCSTCRNLERAYEAGLSEYVEARASVCYRVSTVLAPRRMSIWSAPDTSWKSTGLYAPQPPASLHSCLNRMLQGA